MSSAVLVLFGGPGPDAPMRWVCVSRASGELLQQGELAAVAAAPSATAADTVLVIPGSEAQVKCVQLSASSDAQARAAAGYLFEGALAIEKEHAVFALGAELDSRRIVAAADRRRIQRWIDRCAAAGANPGTIHLDSALWPVTPGTVQVINLGERVIVAGGDLGSFAIEPDLAPALLPSWLAQTPGEVSRIEVSGVDASAFASCLPQPTAEVVQATGPDPLAVLCRAAASPPAGAPNLRQGEFALVKPRGAGVGACGLAAGLALAAAALQLGVMVADGYRDAQAATALDAANEAAFLQLHPETRRVTNLRAQVTAALNSAKRPALNPAILNSKVVTGVLRSHPEVRLDEVRSDRPGRLVTLRFSSAQSPALDAAVADLGATIANLKVGQMQTSEGRVNVTVSVEAL